MVIEVTKTRVSSIDDAMFDTAIQSIIECPYHKTLVMILTVLLMATGYKT